MGDKTTITINKNTVHLLDIVKQYSPEADYDDVIVFLIGQYSKKLEEITDRTFSKSVIMDGVNDE